MPDAKSYPTRMPLFAFAPRASLLPIAKRNLCTDNYPSPSDNSSRATYGSHTKFPSFPKKKETLVSKKTSRVIQQTRQTQPSLTVINDCVVQVTKFGWHLTSELVRVCVKRTSERKTTHQTTPMLRPQPNWQETNNLLKSKSERSVSCPSSLGILPVN